MDLQNFDITLSPLDPKLSKTKLTYGKPTDEKLCYRFDFSWTGYPENSDEPWGIKSKGCLLFINREGVLDWSLAKVGNGYRTFEVHTPTPALHAAVLRAIQSDKAGRAAVEKLHAHYEARQLAWGRDPQYLVNDVDVIKVGA